jgi:hypothetical protein
MIDNDAGEVTLPTGRLVRVEKSSRNQVKKEVIADVLAKHNIDNVENIVEEVLSSREVKKSNNISFVKNDSSQANLSKVVGYNEIN